MRFITFTLALIPFLVFGQKDSIRFHIDINDCDSSVWFLEYMVTNAKGKVIFLDDKPIGYNKDKPCEGQISSRDTSTLINYYKNTLLIDRSRQVADVAFVLIQQNQLDKETERVADAIKSATKTDLFQLIEKEFADSLMGTYRLRISNGSVKTSDCVLMRRPNGQVVIRTGSGQNVQNYSLRFWGDARMEISNLPNDGDRTMLYRIKDNKGRWVSENRKVQVLKSDKLAIENLGK